MKKIILFASLLFFISALGFPATVKVKSPNAPNTKWRSGHTENIEWEATGLSSSDKLKITLWNEDVLVGVIKSDVSPTPAFYSWNVGDYVGGTAAIGSGYYIKIKIEGQASSDMSDHPFEILLDFKHIILKAYPIFLKVLPDLVVTVTYELTPAHPEGYNVSHFHIKVKNIGQGPSDKTTNVGAKLLNWGPTGAAKLSGYDAWWPETVPILAAGGEFNYDRTFNFRAPNYYEIEAWVDSEQKVGETSVGEGNNHFSTGKFKVQ
jgi:hypothetical protein